MYHSLDISVEGNSQTINTWNDWHLIPTAKPVVDPPEFRSNKVEITGRDGELDISTLITNNVPTFDSRTMSVEFIMAGTTDQNTWAMQYRTIQRFLHGKRGNVRLADDDPEWFYTGRFSISGLKPSNMYTTITLDFTLEPYKIRCGGTGDVTDPWMWDPFNFNNYIGTTNPNGRNTML